MPSQKNKQTKKNNKKNQSNKRSNKKSKKRNIQSGGFEETDSKTSEMIRGKRFVARDTEYAFQGAPKFPPPFMKDAGSCVIL